MFVFHNLIDIHRRKVENWERTREEYLNGGSYRYASEYSRQHPHPNEIYKKTSLVIFAGIIIAMLLYGFIGIIKNSVETDKKNREEENKVLLGKNCKAFNNNDHVKINSGDYNGAIGTIIGGCKSDEKYQVKIDAGQKVNIENDGQDAVDVGGKIVEMSSKKDLVEINLPEKKE